MEKHTTLVSSLLAFTLITVIDSPATADETKQSVRITLKDGKVLEYRKEQVAKIEVVEDGKAIESVSRKQAGERAMDWWKSCRAGELKAAMAATADVVVIGERDSRVKDGRPVRPNVWGVRILREKAAIEKLLQEAKARPADIEEKPKVESVRLLADSTLPSAASIVLGEHLPNCRYLVLIGTDQFDDLSEIYVNAQGKIVGFVGVER